jgi:hypothetical protein
MAYNNDHNGWAEWSKYVLKELERLGDNVEGVSGHLSNLPCKSHQEIISSFKDQLNKIINNDLKHVNDKLNTLLFTVLGGIFVAIAVAAINCIAK